MRVVSKFNNAYRRTEKHVFNSIRFVLYHNDRMIINEFDLFFSEYIDKENNTLKSIGINIYF